MKSGNIHRMIWIRTKSVGTIEPDGMLNGSATKERNPIAITTATSNVRIVSPQPEFEPPDCDDDDVCFMLLSDYGVRGPSL